MNIFEFGFAVAFMSCVLHCMVRIVSQFPSGQHNADEPLSRDIQASVESHLKLSGSMGSTFLHDESKEVSRLCSCAIDITSALELWMTCAKRKMAHSLRSDDLVFIFEMIIEL